MQGVRCNLGLIVLPDVLPTLQSGIRTDNPVVIGQPSLPSEPQVGPLRTLILTHLSREPVNMFVCLFFRGDLWIHFD